MHNQRIWLVLIYRFSLHLVDAGAWPKMLRLFLGNCHLHGFILLVVFSAWIYHPSCGGTDVIRNDLPVGYDNPWNIRLLDIWLQENAGCQKECEFGYLNEDDCTCACKPGWRGRECDGKAPQPHCSPQFDTSN